MPPLYLVEQGSKLSHEGRRLVVTKEGKDLLQVPLIKVSEVLIFGNIQITTPALRLCLDEGVDIVFLTQDGRYCGRLVGPPTGYGQLRRFQYQRVENREFSLGTAQSIVAGKLRNMHTLLLRYNRALEDQEIAKATFDLNAMIAQAGRTTQHSSLLGVEGKGTAIYFGVFKRLFKDDWPFEKRVRRPPTDPINVLLSFGYTILQHNIESAVNLVGLDPYLGFLHAVEYNRPSLSLDLMEEFRPIVTDSVVLRVCNSHLVTPANFSKTDDPERPVLLDDEGRANFIREFEARLAQEFKHPDTQERVTYRRCFELQVRRLANCLKSGETYKPFLVR